MCFDIVECLVKKEFKAKMWGPIWVAENNKLMFMYSNIGEIAIAVKARFNCWGNSTDFIVTAIPKSEQEVEIMILTAMEYSKKVQVSYWGRKLNIDRMLIVRKAQMKQLEFFGQEFSLYPH